MARPSAAASGKSELARPAFGEIPWRIGAETSPSGDKIPLGVGGNAPDLDLIEASFYILSPMN